MDFDTNKRASYFSTFHTELIHQVRPTVFSKVHVTFENLVIILEKYVGFVLQWKGCIVVDCMESGVMV